MFLHRIDPILLLLCLYCIISSFRLLPCYNKYQHTWCIVMVYHRGDRLVMLIHTFSVLFLKLNKLRGQNESAIHLSNNVNPAITKIYRLYQKVNGSHHGDSPLLKPTGTHIATQSLPGPTTLEYGKVISVKAMALCTKNVFYRLEGCAASISEFEIQAIVTAVWCAAH